MKNKQHQTHPLTWVFTGLAALFVLAVFLFTQHVRHMQHMGEFHPGRTHRPYFAEGVGTSTPRAPGQFTPEDIRSWMTFAFVDQALGLPPDYLKVQLHISDSAYPNISIRKAAGEQSVAPDAFLATLLSAVRSYKNVAP